MSSFDGLAFEALQVTERGDRVEVLLNRPEVKNAIDEQMVTELHAVCAVLEREPKVLIIAGRDGIFASGADIAQLRERRRDDALRGVNSGIFSRIANLPMPVIAALDGYALGGGSELALAADFRIGAPDIKVGQPETGLGIMAAAGALWRLKEIVGEPLAKEILFAGRILGAEEAERSGYVNSIAEDALAAAHELADRIGSQDPLAVRLSKMVFDMPRDAHPLVDNIGQAICFESEAKFDRMQKFLDRKNKKKSTEEK
ncbi:enoyl-CoA hydratase/isomerase family protein [Corynebacterium vitaeruminis]|uniref:Enoyl-CoA hydratase/isomerase n=1 Tax=Corynebacterium vitaeruminis DSM 20294 TaxID=1224164 RepID=W5Y3P2_9CORY|nr:enoyl-CoA hydratase/isomerase family protein [Corynebacterium vitaeruminis]AHI23470.1 enoyl-CoA hydratase/isomerase [Corynebacterium vitaeruminis DSM 20294]